MPELIRGTRYLALDVARTDTGYEVSGEAMSQN
jgi:hypothetical protein